MPVVIAGERETQKKKLPEARVCLNTYTLVPFLLSPASTSTRAARYTGGRCPGRPNTSHIRSFLEHRPTLDGVEERVWERIAKPYDWTLETRRGDHHYYSRHRYDFRILHLRARRTSVTTITPLPIPLTLPFASPPSRFAPKPFAVSFEKPERPTLRALGRKGPPTTRSATDRIALHIRR